MENAVEVTDFNTQIIKLYLAEDVNEELNNKITWNFSSTNDEQRERAALLFKLLNRGLYDIANGNSETDDITNECEYFYDAYDGYSNVIATIIHNSFTNDNHE